MENTIGERIKQIRDENGLTQKEFADRLNSSRSHISGAENNSVPISDRLIKLICMEFNINEEWLRKGVGEKSSTAIEAKKAWDEEVKGLNDVESTFKYIYRNHERYMVLAALLAPGGALIGKIPLQYEPDLVCMVNYLQYLFSQAKDEKDKMRITVKFESIFPDYIDIVSKLTNDFKNAQKEMGKTLRNLPDYDELFTSVNKVIEAFEEKEKEIKELEEVIRMQNEVINKLQENIKE